MADTRSWVDWFFCPAPLTLDLFEELGEKHPDQFFPTPSGLLWSLPAALLLLLLRFTYDKLFAQPFARYRHVSNKPAKVTPNPTLEAVWRKTRGRLSEVERDSLAARLQTEPRDIDIWMRQRRLLNQPTRAQKFEEASWRFFYYTICTVYGTVILWNEPWFFHSEMYWVGYPEQHVSLEVRIYYLVQLGAYIAMLITLSTDSKRKDFWEMLIHHFATILLIGLSWCANYVRIGTMVLILHDVADIFLESAKALHYAKFNGPDYLFAVFAVVFGVSRLVLYPIYVMQSMVSEIEGHLMPCPSFSAFRVLLSVLLCLHIFWFKTIMDMVMSFMREGELTKDARSPSGSEDEGEEEDHSPKNKKKN